MAPGVAWHPAEWSGAFGSVPIYICGADRQWIMRPDPMIRHIATMIKHYHFERIYGPCLHSVIPQGGSSAVEQSIARYIDRVQG